MSTERAPNEQKSHLYIGGVADCDCYNRDYALLRLGGALSTPGSDPLAVEIPLNVGGAAGLGSLQLELTYDTTHLKLQNVLPGQLSKNSLLDHYIANPGLVRIGIVDSSGINGDGAIVTLIFWPTGQGGSTTLALENVEVTDVDLRDLVVQVSPGEFAGKGGPLPRPLLSFRR